MSKPHGSNADKWTYDDTSILIHILYDDAKNYEFNGSIINAPRWKEIIDEFWSKSGKKDIYDEQQIKSKHNRLRTDTKNFKELLLNCSGYGWDPVTNTGSCPSGIWEAHLSENIWFIVLRLIPHNDQINQLEWIKSLFLAMTILMVLGLCISQVVVQELESVL